MPITVTLCVLLDSLEWIFRTYTLNVLTWLGLLLLCMIFFTCAHIQIFQEEMISLRLNLHRNNYPERITSAPRNLVRRIEDNTRKLTTEFLPYVKWLVERTQKICSPYDIRTVFTSGSTLWRYSIRVKPPTEFNMIKNSIPWSCGKIYKGETGHPLKVRPEELRKVVVRGEIEKLGMADHI